MTWTGHEAYFAAGCALFNYLVTELGAWMHAKAERVVYDEEVERIQVLERLGVFARQLRVRGEAARSVRIGKSYEDGVPPNVDQFAWLRSEPVELVDDTGNGFALEPGASLHVGYLEGERDRFEVDNAGELYDFRIKPEQSFYMLMTDAGLYPIPRGRPFTEPYYHMTTRVSDFEREVEPRGAFAAWIVLPLMAGLFLASHYYLLADNREMRIGLMLLTVGIWLFVCLSQLIFEAPFPRLRTSLPVRRWRPELR